MLFWQELLDFFVDLFSYLASVLYFSGIVLTNLLTWLTVYQIHKISTQSEEIALHYNVDFGINYIGSVNNIFIIPLAGLLVLFFNLFLLWVVKKNFLDKRFNRHLILAATLVANIFLLIGAVTLYYVNSNQ